MARTVTLETRAFEGVQNQMKAIELYARTARHLIDTGKPDEAQKHLTWLLQAVEYGNRYINEAR